LGTSGERSTAAAVQNAISVEPWDRRQDRRALVGLVLVAWVVYLATATYSSFQLNDNRAVNLSAWSLGTRGTLELPDGWNSENRWVIEGRSGGLYTDRFPGAILWATPFHAGAELLLRRGQPDHPVFLNYAPGGVAAATVTALALGVSFLLFRRLANRRLAVAASGVLGFGTAVWSISADAMWTHGLTHLTLMLGVLAAADGRDARSGLAFAASIITRPHTAVVAAVVGVWSARVSRSWRPAMVIGVLSSLGVLALSGYSRALFGTWLPAAGYRTDTVSEVVSNNWLDMGPQLFYTMAHPLRGVFIYSPFLLFLLPFARHGWRASPWWVRSAAIGGLLYLILQLRLHPWAGGGSFFGSRLTIEALVLSAPLLLRTWQSHVRSIEPLRGAVVGLALVSIGLHSVGATVRTIHPESRNEWQSVINGFCEEDPQLSGC
jgi:hypothetical protein